MDSILEFANDRLIIHINPNDLLITKDWSVIHRIDDPDKGNTTKYQLALIPSFDETSLPFVLMSGVKSLNIVNVKKFNIQPLVLSPIYTYRGQQAFYLTEDKDGVNLFFAT